MIKMCSFCVVVDWVFHQIDGNGEMIRDFPYVDVSTCVCLLFMNELN
jgi:hypothetical protein